MDATNLYFDFYDIIVNELIGDLNLAVFLTTVILLIVLRKTRVPYEATLLLIIDWLAIWFAYAQGLLIIWVLIVFFVAVNLGYMFNKFIRR